MPRASKASAPLLPRQLSGRLVDGAQRGGGTRVHLVPDGAAWGRALCGATPGRRSGSGFLPPADPQAEATCPRCRRRAGLDREAAVYRTLAPLDPRD